MNGFGLEGARAMEEALKTNRILVELHCTNCRIPLEGAPHIAAGLQINESLVKFYVSNRLHIFRLYIRVELGLLVKCNGFTSLAVLL